MPSNPSIIPGVMRADTSGLARIGQAIGEIIGANKKKMEEARELYNDPVFMEPMAEAMVAAQARDELNPDFGAIASNANAQSELSRVQDSAMVAANLDPQNSAHREMALSFLGTAFDALPLPQRAQIRYDQTEKAQETKAKQIEKADENITEALNLENKQVDQAAWELDVMRRMWRSDLTILENQKAAEVEISRLRAEMVTKLKEDESLLMKFPQLQELLTVGGPEAFAEGVLTLMRMPPAQAVRSIDDMETLVQLGVARETNFAEEINRIIEEGLEGDAALAAVSGALNVYHQYGDLQAYGLENSSLFPVMPIAVTKLGRLGGKKGKRLMWMFGLPPEGRHAMDPLHYAGWRDSIIRKYRKEGATATWNILKDNPTWNAMDEDQQRYTLGVFSSRGVHLPQAGLSPEMLGPRETGTAAPVIPVREGAGQVRDPQPVYPRRPGQ